MPSADELLAMYQRQCLQNISVRRYSGTGVARTKNDYAAHGNAHAYSAKELVVGITQGDIKVVVIANDLVANNLTLPVITSDKVVVDGRECAIHSDSGPDRRGG
jgi:hypothetical protein